jgi:hypothetical protein
MLRIRASARAWRLPTRLWAVRPYALFNDSATKPWEVARALLEQDKAVEAHSCSADAVKAALDYSREHRDETEADWMLPLLLLELGKAFLQLVEHQDAVTAFKHAKALYEGERIFICAVSATQR